MNADSAAGSHLWQMVFVSFAIVLVLFQMLRGWQLGLLRQIVRIFATVAAYGAAIFGGRAVAPLVRPLLRLPDVVLAVIAGAILAALVYAVINGIGRLLFRSTRQHESGFLRVVYGASGAFIGIFFGLFFVWLLLIGIRSLGSVAEAGVRAPRVSPAPANARRIVNGRLVPADATDPNSAPELLARLKNSIELGSLGEIVRKADPLPNGSLDALGKLSETLSNQHSTERFLSFPGVREISRHPRIVELEQDPKIVKLVNERRYLELLQEPRVINALNDPTFIERIKQFDLRGALDYARRNPPDEQPQQQP